MIKILKRNGQLQLKYTSDRYSNASWIDEKLRADGTVGLAVLCFTHATDIAPGRPLSGRGDLFR